MTAASPKTAAMMATFERAKNHSICPPYADPAGVSIERKKVVMAPKKGKGGKRC